MLQMAFPENIFEKFAEAILPLSTRLKRAVRRLFTFCISGPSLNQLNFVAFYG